MNSKEQRSIAVGDEKRFMIAKSNALMPGGPQNNSPIAVEQASGVEIKAKSIYNDFSQNYAALGTKVLDPISQAPSKLQREVGGMFPMGQRLNGVAPYGMLPNPTNTGDIQEARRLGGNSYMGMIGLPAQPAPGAFPGPFPGSSGPPLLTGMQSAENAVTRGMQPKNSMSDMTPGANKTTIPRKTTKRA